MDSGRTRSPIAPGPGLPDGGPHVPAPCGRQRRQVAVVASAGDGSLAWEYLRRSPDYRKAWAAAAFRPLFEAAPFRFRAQGEAGLEAARLALPAWKNPEAPGTGGFPVLGRGVQAGRRPGGRGRPFRRPARTGPGTGAACRFFPDGRVSEEENLRGHFDATPRRFAAGDGPILILHDTAERSWRRGHPEAVGIATPVSSGAVGAEVHGVPTVDALRLRAAAPAPWRLCRASKRVLVVCAAARGSD